MFNRFTLMVGQRYALSRHGSHLVSFISRLSVVGLVISVALLILVMSIMNGFDRELRERILQIMPQATLYKHDGIADPSAIMQRALSHPEVLAAAPYVRLEGLLSHGKEVAPVLAFGIAPELEAQVSSVRDFLRHGALPQLAGDAPAIILGSALARSLAVDKGEAISLIVPRADAPGSANARVLTVVDILDTGTELDNNLALMNLSAASQLTPYPGRVSGIRLQVRDLFRASQTVYELSAQLPHGYYGKDWTRTHGNLYQAILMSKKLVSLLLLLLIGIAAFNLITTLIMVVVDKEGDIAILRTQGARTADIVGIFVVQGGIIGLLGTVLGALLGVLLSLVVTDAVAALERAINFQFLHSDVYPVSYLPAQLLWQDVGYVCAAALVLSVLASIYPAWRAARIRPAEALRYE